MPVIVKITTPWQHPFLKDQIHSKLKERFVFEIDNDVNVCDYWIIWGGLPPNIDKLTVKCNFNNVFFMTDEAHDQISFPPNFLAQFNTILSLRDDLKHSNVLKIHEFNTWHLDRSIDYLLNVNQIPKSKQISVICSDLTFLIGHKKRFAFVNKLIGHFKDRIDIYGRGFNQIPDKWDALAPYKYSIAIENNQVNGYFTEKITECFLTHTHPLYIGAPNIYDFFPQESITNLQIDDYRKSIDIIERLLEIDPYADKLQSIIEAKKIYLEKLQLFSAISNLLTNTSYVTDAKKDKITISNKHCFTPYYYPKKIGRKLSKILKLK